MELGARTHVSEQYADFLRAIRAQTSWRRVRELVKARAVAIYWQQRTVEHLCAPGREGRQQDLEAFMSDFVQ